MKRRIDAIIFGMLALASFLLYLRTLAPDVVDADGGEFQFAAWNFGFVHPTGYPLFLMLGGTFQHVVPIGNPAFRLNLFNAFIAAFVVAMVYLVALEFARHRVASIIAAAVFGLTRTFWYDASAAEVYALNVFFVALLLFIVLRWQCEPTAGKFAAFCWVFGLALTHHRTVMLWVPAFLIFIFLVARREQFRFHPERIKAQVALFMLALLIPLLLYLYVPLRAPASPYFALPLTPHRTLILYDNSVAGFIDYLVGRTFQAEMGWDAVSVARLMAFPQLLLDQFGVLGMALGILGFVAMLWRREWTRFILLFVGFATTILFASIYHIGDIVHYYIPAYLAWAIWGGYAIAWLGQLVSHFTFHVSRFVSAFCLLLSACLLVPQLTANFSFADRSGETRVREHWTRLTASAPQNAILISNDRDEMMPLWYFQYVENTRREVLGLFPRITPAPEHANVVRLTDSVLDTNRPVYFIKPMPGIEIKYRFEQTGELWRVSAQPRVPHQSSDAVLANRVRVIGYDVVRETNALRVAIFWQPIAKLDANYTTFIHLLDSRGNKIAQGNDHQVGGEFYPTALWQIGEMLRDEFVISLPPNLAPGNYRWLVGMYRSSDGERLGEPVVVGTVEIY